MPNNEFLTQLELQLTTSSFCVASHPSVRPILTILHVSGCKLDNDIDLSDKLLYVSSADLLSGIC